MSNNLPHDSRPLTTAELFDEDKALLKGINATLKGMMAEVRARRQAENDEVYSPFARVDPRRTPRVLLLSGPRGVGKTSLMLTSIEAWGAPHSADELASELANELDPGSEVGGKCRVLPPLDFDPMPPGMPLVPWIIGALRRVVDFVLEQQPTGRGRCEDGEGVSLEDRWDRLYDTALAGWHAGSFDTHVESEGSRRMVKAWTRLQDDWNCALDHLFKAMRPRKETPGKSKNKDAMIGEDGLLILPIDDLDMQIRRTPEAARALRHLYHPRLVFLVTGNQELIEDVLQDEVNGQRKKLAEGLPKDEWQAQARAESDMLGRRITDKVFRDGLTWKVELLNLEQVLGWSDQAILKLLDDGDQKRWVAAARLPGVGPTLQMSRRDVMDLRARVSGAAAAQARNDEMLNRLTDLVLRRSYVHWEREGDHLKSLGGGDVLLVGKEARMLQGDGLVQPIFLPRTFSLAPAVEGKGALDETVGALLELGFAVDSKLRLKESKSLLGLVVVKVKNSDLGWPFYAPSTQMSKEWAEDLAEQWHQWLGSDPLAFSGTTLVSRWMSFSGWLRGGDRPDRGDALVSVVAKHRLRRLGEMGHSIEGCWGALVHPMFALGRNVREDLVSALLGWRDKDESDGLDEAKLLEERGKLPWSAAAEHAVVNASNVTIALNDRPWLERFVEEPWLRLEGILELGPGVWILPFLQRPRVTRNDKRLISVDEQSPLFIRMVRSGSREIYLSSLIQSAWIEGSRWVGPDHPLLFSAQAVGDWMVETGRFGELPKLWDRLLLGRERQRGFIPPAVFLSLVYRWLASAGPMDSLKEEHLRLTRSEDLLEWDGPPVHISTVHGSGAKAPVMGWTMKVADEDALVTYKAGLRMALAGWLGLCRSVSDYLPPEEGEAPSGWGKVTFDRTVIPAHLAGWEHLPPFLTWADLDRLRLAVQRITAGRGDSAAEAAAIDLQIVHAVVLLVARRFGPVWLGTSLNTAVAIVAKELEDSCREVAGARSWYGLVGQIWLVLAWARLIETHDSGIPRIRREGLDKAIGDVVALGIVVESDARGQRMVNMERASFERRLASENLRLAAGVQVLVLPCEDPFDDRFRPIAGARDAFDHGRAFVDSLERWARPLGARTDVRSVPLVDVPFVLAMAGVAPDQAFGMGAGLGGLKDLYAMADGAAVRPPAGEVVQDLPAGLIDTRGNEAALLIVGRLPAQEDLLDSALRVGFSENWSRGRVVLEGQIGEWSKEISSQLKKRLQAEIVQGTPAIVNVGRIYVFLNADKPHIAATVGHAIRSLPNPPTVHLLYREPSRRPKEPGSVIEIVLPPPDPST